jgi:predicted nucleic acid-binding protein
VAVYLDTSALVKLVVAERETPELVGWLRTSEVDGVASDLVRTELSRAVRRAEPSRVVAAREVLAAVGLIAVTPSVLDAAGRLEPPRLRTLDAIHLASALELGDDLEAMVTYDERLAEAAVAHGVAVLAPGEAAGPG